MTWAQCGAGIALVPSSMAKAGGEDLLKIPLKDQGVMSRIALIARKHGMVSRVSREFSSFSKLLCELGCYVPVEHVQHRPKRSRDAKVQST